MARTLSGDTEARQARQNQILLERTTVRFQRSIATEIRRAMNSIAQSIMKSDSIETAVRIERHRLNVENLLFNLYEYAAERTVDITAPPTEKSVRLQGKEDDSIFAGTSVANRIATDWMLMYGASKITRISRTTEDDVKAALVQGVNKGLSERNIAKLVALAATTKSASRSQTIARTETRQSMSIAARAVAKQSSIEMVKKWSASRGERTRPAHREADGQTVGLDEHFVVGGEQLMFPGDPDGSAKNVINCRCDVLYIPKRG